MNSKMDRLLNTKNEKQSIYEIFRACRLCGAGGGYKMPIIQSIPLDIDEDVELRQKIRECVQIEVHQNDKMPPLICELCVDKINDYYEFLEMCRQTNKKTRLRLGLPPQTLPQGAPDAGDCILGVTEPVYINEDSNDMPLSKQKMKIKVEQSEKSKKVEVSAKSKRKLSPPPEEPKVILTRRSIKIEATRPTRQQTENSHSSRDAKPNRSLRDTKTRIERVARSPTPPPRRTTRQHHEDTKEDTMKLSSLRQDSKQAARQTRLSSSSSKDSPKSILKVKTEDTSLLKPRELGKRTKGREQQKNVPVKKVKIAIKPVPVSPKQERRGPPTPPPPPVQSRRLQAATPPTPAAPKEEHKCMICNYGFVKPASLSLHMRSHVPCYTSSRMACNACSDWFNTSEETAIHHRWHRVTSTPYHCRLCTADFRQQNAYNDHFEKNSCVPSAEVPDLKCEGCWGLYPTQNLLDQHKCPGEDGRPGGKCYKCLRTYVTVRTLRKHEESCRAKKKDDLTINPDVFATLRNVQIRFARCDPLLSYRVTDDGHYDISGVKSTFGLDNKCEYPFFASARAIKIKLEPDEFDGMVNIKDDLLDLDEAIVHWDSDDSGSSVEEVEDIDDSNLVVNPFVKRNKTPRVESLTRLSIKTIFSPKFLGKVPKRKRKLKFENLKSESDFESLLQDKLDEEVHIGVQYKSRKSEDKLSSPIPGETETKILDNCQKTNQLTEVVNKNNETGDTDKIDSEDHHGSQPSNEMQQEPLEYRGKDDGDNLSDIVSEESDKGNEYLTKDLDKCNGDVVGIQQEKLNESAEPNESSSSVHQGDVEIIDAPYNTKVGTNVEADSEEATVGRSEMPTEVDEEIARNDDANVSDVIESDDKHGDTPNDIDKHELGEPKGIIEDVPDNDASLIDKTTDLSNHDDSSKPAKYSNLSEITNENKGKMVDLNSLEEEQDITNSSKHLNKLNVNTLTNRDDRAPILCESKCSVNGDVKVGTEGISDNDYDDMSDSDLDDKKLLEALDEQIDDIDSGKTAEREAARERLRKEETLTDNLGSSKNLEGCSEALSCEKDSEENSRCHNESQHDLEQENEEEHFKKSAETTDNRLEVSKDKLEDTSVKSRMFLGENREDSNLRDGDENSGVVQNDSRREFDVSEVEKDKSHLLEATSNSNSLDTPDKCLEYITHERENYLLSDKTEDYSSKEESEKINIEDIVTSRNDKSMDLDSISDDEFDFDT